MFEDYVIFLLFPRWDIMLVPLRINRDPPKSCRTSATRHPKRRQSNTRHVASHDFQSACRWTRGRECVSLGKVNAPNWIQDTGEKQLCPRMCRQKIREPNLFQQQYNQ